MRGGLGEKKSFSREMRPVLLAVGLVCFAALYVSARDDSEGVTALEDWQPGSHTVDLGEGRRGRRAQKVNLLL